MGIENPEQLSSHAEVYVDPELKSGKSSDPIDSSVQETELEDIVALLDRETHDGPGDLNDLPESNFHSYATEGVEKGETA